MNLTTFPTEQLNLFKHTLDGITLQLDDLSLDHLSEEGKKQQETLLHQAYELEEQVNLEIARRSLACLQAQLGGEEQLTLEMARRQLLYLQAQISNLTLHGKDEPEEVQQYIR